MVSQSVFEQENLPIEKREEREKNPNKTKRGYIMGAKVYPSDLTDTQWTLLEPLISRVSEGAAHVLHER